MEKLRIGYRYKVTKKQDNSVLGTGFMTSSTPLNQSEQVTLFHNMMHGKYSNAENYINVEISRSDQ